MFGQGIVKSLDDFGTQGRLPTPSRTARLAGGRVHRQRLGREAPAQADGACRAPTGSRRVASKELRERDPYNVWLARQGRFRLDAEMVRDNALAVSGLLSPKIGGPSVKPYQPAGYWSYLNFPKREWANDKGENLYRRGLYTYWCRTFLHPSLVAFDAPTREECTVERPRSNTPLQALVLLNDPTYVEAARVFAERIVREGGADAGGAARLGLPPRAVARRRSRRSERCSLALLREAPGRVRAPTRTPPQKLVSVGEYPAPKDLDVAELAAWTSVARVMLNLHETITRN